MSELFDLPGPRRVRGLDPQLAQLRLARNPIGRMTELFERWGAPVALVRGGGGRVFSTDRNCPGVVFIRGRELSREVELDHETFHRSSLVGQLSPSERVDERRRPLLEWGTGLFAVNGDEHRRQRGLIAQFLTRSKVEGYLGEILAATRSQVSNWRPGAYIDMHLEMMDLTVKIAAKTLLGLDIDVEQEIFRSGAESLRLVLSPSVLLVPWDLPGLPYRRFLNAVATFNSKIRQVVEERRGSARRPDVLSALIGASDEVGSLSATEVVGHASVIYAASHETTGNALTWTFFLLSQHPEWQKAASEEVKDVVKGEEPTPDDLEKLETLDAVLRESLRILPSAPWTTRIASKDTTIGGRAVPSGTEIVVSIFHTHRESSLYDRPNEFDPSRWSRIQPDVFQFNAFSAGPRACVGRSFATLEMKAVLAMVLRRFRVELDGRRPVDPVLNITLAPRRGVGMRVGTDSRFGDGVGRARGRVRALVRLP